jgi:hypothetical protein
MCSCDDLLSPGQAIACAAIDVDGVIVSFSESASLRDPTSEQVSALWRIPEQKISSGYDRQKSKGKSNRSRSWRLIATRDHENEGVFSGLRILT